LYQIKKERITTLVGQYIFNCRSPLLGASLIFYITAHTHFFNILVRQSKATFQYTSASSAILPVNSLKRSAATLTKRAEK